MAIAAASLALSNAALAGGFDPNVINGAFTTQDGGPGNTLTTVADLGFFGAFGEVICGTTGNMVRIDYESEAPDKGQTSERNVKVQDKSQVDIHLVVDTSTASFDSDQIIDDCKLGASMSGKANPGPDTVQSAKAKLSCDLGKDFKDMQDDQGFPPGPEDLGAIDSLCSGRKDVKIDTKNGKLDVRHDGKP